MRPRGARTRGGRLALRPGQGRHWRARRTTGAQTRPHHIQGVAMIGKLTLSSATLLLVASAAFAAPPVEDIGKRHPNLAAAQRLSRNAWERVTAAQKANEW